MKILTEKVKNNRPVFIIYSILNTGDEFIYSLLFKPNN